MTTLKIRLSDATIKKALKNTKHKNVSELRDSHTRLRLRINKARTGGTWYAVLYSGGKTEWKKLGNFPVIPFKLMEEKLPDILAKYAIGDAVLTNQWLKVSGLLEWYEGRLNSDHALTEKRKVSVRSAIKCHLMPKLGGLNICELDRKAIDERLIWPLQQDYTASFIRQIWGVLKTATRRAHKLQLLVDDPLVSLKLTDFMEAKPTPKPAAIRPDYAPELIKNLGAQAWPVKTFVSLMLLHGSRIGETRKAKWSDFDMINGYWHLPAKNVKTREALRLPLTETAKHLLNVYRERQKGEGKQSLYLFPITKNKGWSESKAGEVIREASSRKWQAHDIRKLARTEWADLGIDYHISERLLNHKMSMLDQTYIHTSTEAAKRDALEKYHIWLNAQGFKTLTNQDNTEI